MSAYIIRRILYSIPIILGVCLVTFALFNLIIPADTMARKVLGKNPTQEQVDAWITEHGYDKKIFVDFSGDRGFLDTQFVNYMSSLARFDFGESQKTNESIGAKLRGGMGPSLMLTVPAFILTIWVSLSISLFVAYFRGTYLDIGGVVICVLAMSCPAMVYIIAGQYFFAVVMKLFPVYGFSWGPSGFKFLLLPIVISLIAGLGGNVRFYRTVVLDEINADYARTARAKGLSETCVLFKHVLKNSMIPVLTSVVLAIPFLFMGSLLLESFFGIPGIGGITVDAIFNADFAVVRAMVFLGSILYVIGNLMTDISYCFVDPRISLR